MSTSPGHLLVRWHQLAFSLSASDWTWTAAKLEAVLKIMPYIRSNLPRICASSWRVQSGFKISFISAVQMTLAHKGHPLCFCAQGGTSPEFIQEKEPAQRERRRKWRLREGVGMGAQIMWWSAEAWNTNKRWKSKFRASVRVRGDVTLWSCLRAR